VWIGNDDNTSLPRNMTNADGTRETVTSSRQPIYAWNAFVEGALQGRPANASGFPVPDGIVFHRIDRRTGALTSAGTAAAFRATTDLSAGGVAGALQVEVPIDNRTGLRATSLTPFEFVEVIRVDPADLDRVLGGGPELSPP